ncbi:hypothetical protein [Acinetobacter guillouiae]|nr:hypothetical protein [Acinetobacter guillouiae]
MNSSKQIESSIDQVCLQRLNSPDFAIKQSFFDKLLYLFKGAAK